MFDINIWPLLDTFTGDSLSFQFEGEVPSDTFPDIQILGVLRFTLTLIATDTGIEAILRGFEGKALYEGKEEKFSMGQIERTFNRVYDPLAPDDIGTIDMKNATIDLGKVIREEIIMDLAF